jgi:hypothetical protein
VEKVSAQTDGCEAVLILVEYSFPFEQEAFNGISVCNCLVVLMDLVELGRSSEKKENKMLRFRSQHPT